MFPALVLVAAGLVIAGLGKIVRSSGAVLGATKYGSVGIGIQWAVVADKSQMQESGEWQVRPPTRLGGYPSR